MRSASTLTLVFNVQIGFYHSHGIWKIAKIYIDIVGCESANGI